MPWRSVDDGTIRNCGSSRRVMVSSKLRNQNRRFFFIGPPTEAPNTFRINLGRSSVLPVKELMVELLKKLLADVTVLRWYSYIDPWKTFVPLSVISET